MFPAFWEGTHSCIHRGRGTRYHGSIKVEVGTTFTFTFLYVNFSCRALVALSFIYFCFSLGLLILFLCIVCILSEGGLTVSPVVLFTRVLKRVEQHYTSALCSMHSTFCSLVWMFLNVHVPRVHAFAHASLLSSMCIMRWVLIFALRGCQWWPDWNHAPLQPNQLLVGRHRRYQPYITIIHP